MNLERIANLLATGLKSSQVASIIGVTPARISQITATEEFKQILEVRQAEINASNVEEIALDAKYHAAESSLVTQVLETAPMAELKDVIAALRVIGERQDRRKIPSNPVPSGIINGTTINNIITLSVPQHAVPEITLSAQKEIISIGNKQLAPMNSDRVTELFNKIGDNHDLRRISESTTETIKETTLKTCQTELVF